MSRGSSGTGQSALLRLRLTVHEATPLTRQFYSPQSNIGNKQSERRH